MTSATPAIVICDCGRLIWLTRQIASGPEGSTRSRRKAAPPKTTDHSAGSSQDISLLGALRGADRETWTPPETLPAA